MAWWVPLATAAASVVSALMQNDQASKQSKALSNTASENNELLWAINQQNRSDLLPYRQSGYNALGLYNAALGIDPTHTGYYDAVSAALSGDGNNLFSGTGGSTTPVSSPKYGEDGYKAPKTDIFGTPSLGASVGHNPDIFTALSNGDAGTWDWWADGGPSVSAGLSQGLAKQLGLPTGADVLDKDTLDPTGGNFNNFSRAGGASLGARTLEQMGRSVGLPTPLQAIFGKPENTYIWGKPSDNAETFGQYDWNGYVDNYDDLSARWNDYESGNVDKGSKQYRRMLESFDMNGNKLIDKGEFGLAQATANDVIGSGKREVPMLEATAAGGSNPWGGGLGGTGQAGGGKSMGYQEYTPDDARNIFHDSLYYQTAMDGLGQDALQLNAAGAKSGNLLSGAQWKALQDRSVARGSGQALNGFMGGLANLSGIGYNATGAAGNDSSSTAGAVNENNWLAASTTGNQRNLADAALQGFLAGYV